VALSGPEAVDREGLAGLTDRELQVLTLLGEGSASPIRPVSAGRTEESPENCHRTLLDSDS
jgi:hypothetical protein